MASPLLIRKIYYHMATMMENLPAEMYFHNLQHTHDVFLVATEIALMSAIPQQDLLVLQLAALFHDTGYLNIYEGHENQSKAIAANFLRQENCSENLVVAVTSVIEATKVPQNPQNDIQRIICDADLFHLSQPDYTLYADRLRREWTVHLNKRYTDNEWYANNLVFLRQHRYFTGYGQEVLEACKQRNIQELERWLAVS